MTASSLQQAQAQWLTGYVVRFRSGVCRLYLFPQDVAGMLDAVLSHMQPVVIVWGVDYAVWDPRKSRRAAGRSLERLARAAGIEYFSHPARDDVIALARDDVPALLDGIFHWNFHCWDAPRRPHPSALTRQVTLVENTFRGRRNSAMLHRLEGPHVYIDSHDDDSLIFEARDAAPA